MSSFGENGTDEPGSVDIQSPGVRLRRAREACELTQEEVATHLKLSVEKIESLERGEVENIAAPVFVSGYLRSYARLVNLSGDDIVAEFKMLTDMESPSVDPLSGPAANDYGQVGKASSTNMFLSSGNGFGTLIIAGIIVFLLVAGYVYFTGDGESAAKDNVAAEVSSEEALLGNKESTVRSVKTDLEENELSENIAKTEIPSPFPADKESKTNTPVQSDDLSDDIMQSEEFSELALYFIEESWVEVKDFQNKRHIYQLAKAGMSHTITGVAPFRVRLGFVNGVTIMYNGKPYDLSRFIKGKSARFIVGKKGDQMGGNP